MKKFYAVYETGDPYEPPHVVGFYKSRVRAIIAAFIHAEGKVWRLVRDTPGWPPDVYVEEETFKDG